MSPLSVISRNVAVPAAHAQPTGASGLAEAPAALCGWRGSERSYACDRSCANCDDPAGPTDSVVPVMEPVATASRAVIPG